MDHWKGKVALVTGSSAGIGEAIAKSLTKSGMIVIGVARNTAKIESLSSELSSTAGKLVPMSCDIRVEEQVKKVFAFAKQNFGGVDVCVNNAGLSHDAPIFSGATEDWRDMLETNVLAVSVITREFMSQIKERGVDDGHIIILNSLSGHRALNSPSYHFYTATKFALTGLTEGIRYELRNMKSNIRVSAVSPGLVRTEFRARSLKQDEIQADKFYDSAFYNGLIIEAEDVASAVVFALSAPLRTEVNDIYMRPTGQTY